MSPFFDNLEEQLRAAAHARGEEELPAPREQGRGWLRSGARAVPVLLAVGTTLAVAVGALLLLGHQKSPPQSTAAGHGQNTLQQIIRSTPQRMLRQEGSYIRLASQDAQRAHPRLCAPGIPARSSVHGSPGQTLLSMLGVLRRPASPPDQAGAQQFSGMPGIYAGSIHRAFVAGGVSYYVAAARSDPAAYQPSPRCFALDVAALHADLSRIPASLRAPTLRLQSAYIAFDSKLIAAGPSQIVCIATAARREGGSQCGFSAAQIAAGIVPSDNNGTFSGIVPDGVATVTVFWRPAHGPERSATSRVVENVYAVPAGSASVTAVKAVWRSEQGQVIKTISPPSARAVARYCRHNPIPCVATGGATVEQLGSSSSGAAFRGTASAPSRIVESSSSSAAAAPPGASGSSSSGIASQASSSSSGG